MLQEFVDNVIAVIKESVKTFTYESLNNIARLINGISALLLTLLPGKANMLEGISGWELRPSFRGPRLPRWMERHLINPKKVPIFLGTSVLGEGFTLRIKFSNEQLTGGVELLRTSILQLRFSSNQCLTLFIKARIMFFLLLRYPFEAIKVVTSDGYVLLLERIPRRDSQKVVLLQHGILDSSMGWVSNGVVGSPAFAAYDQGYDVFLGNLRGLVSREHVDKNISSYKYWKYSVNEHGTKDMPAIVEEIHKIKTSELGKSRPHISEETEDQNDKIKNLEVQASQDDERDNQPYKLCAVCHSLGGAVMLMYVVTSRIAQKPHRLSRLVLLSPAGFHEDSNVVFSMVEKLILFVGPVLAPFIPGLYIPTRFFRMLLNKLARDFNNYPALGGLVQTLMGYVVGGDSSNWVGVLGLPHYNMDDMPGVSFHVALHLAQIKRAKRFQMYDYGSPVANMEAYGTPEPLDLGAHYGLIDIPVDLVAGQRDRVISPSMVKKHYKLMRKTGVEVSYNEFEYAHLDFTFSHREELLSYVMSRLLLVSDPGKGRIKQTSVRLRKLKKAQSEIENDCDSKEHNGIDNAVTDEQNGHENKTSICNT
uniref:Partial AB-hydrolase lipase domain-containing protein n=1 Tax=Oryza meridionalis TaxID=40149 RepID=A0A0E0C2Z5_9ORYZ